MQHRGTGRHSLALRCPHRGRRRLKRKRLQLSVMQGLMMVVVHRVSEYRGLGQGTDQDQILIL